MRDDDPFLGPHNPTVYLSRAEMKAAEANPVYDDEIPFCEQYDESEEIEEEI